MNIPISRFAIEKMNSLGLKSLAPRIYLTLLTLPFEASSARVIKISLARLSRTVHATEKTCRAGMRALIDAGLVKRLASGYELIDCDQQHFLNDLRNRMNSTK